MTIALIFIAIIAVLIAVSARAIRHDPPRQVPASHNVDAGSLPPPQLLSR